MNSMMYRFFPLILTAMLACFETTAQCDSDAGTMDLTPIQACEGETANANATTGAFLEPDDVLEYALHTNPGASLGAVISIENTPSFGFQSGSMSYGTIYYISAIAGNDDGSGNVDLTDLCLSVAEGTPVVFNEPVTIECNPSILCNGQFNPACEVTGGTPPYQFQWSPATGASDPTILNPVLTSGFTYSLFITDAAGCTAAFPIAVTTPAPMFITISGISELSCENGSVPLAMTVTGGIPPYIYQWSNGATTPDIVVNDPGVYTAIVTDQFGCQAVGTFVVTLSTVDCGTIQGTLVYDENENCAEDAGEPALAGWMVRATGGEVFYDFTDDAGHYIIPVTPGNYDVELLPPANGYWEGCQGTVSASVASNTDSDTIDFQVKALIDCPLLEVDISTPFFRRCFTNTNYISYCNLGTTDATDAYVEVTFDPLMSVTSASIPFSGPVNGVYTFEIGDVAVGECGNFSIQTLVSCNAVLGQTFCSEAHIFPDSICLPVDPLWSGAFIEITQECTADSVIFTIQNTGAGDMTEPVGFIVVEDGVMLMQGTNEVTLQAGEAVTISFPANGSTYALIAGQVENAPGQSSPLLTVEACGTNGVGSFSTGFVTQFPENDADPFVSFDCHEVIGSYDPNDKHGFPKGFGIDRLIEPGQALDYHIRFQNTGTDTAFTVVIEDVMAPELDLATLRPGASSHPYKLEIRTDTIVFIFENILLPDSNVNEPASHGFVKFRIGQKPGLPLGTVIENEAAIFFDFNDPVITNTTLHRLGEPFKLTDSKELFLKKFNCLVFPNPFSKTAHFIVQGAENETFDLHLYDLTGRRLRSQVFTGGFTQIHREGLPPGLYFYEIKMNGVTVGQGKLAVE